MKYTEKDYINFDPFAGDDGEVTLSKVKIVKARKEHNCFYGLGSFGNGHKIQKGDTYRYQKALIDGDFFGEYRLCLTCMNKYLDEMYCDENLT